MAYIAPNSTIKLYDNVPLDNSYRNTLYFASVTDRDAYFHGGGNSQAHAVATLNDQMYQRVDDGVCRVQVPYSQAYSVSYMAFKNTSFENKWFYAFVTNVSYINNNVVEIEYEIDVMITYFHDVLIKPCLVEREMINKNEDTIGANILPEHFELGEYVHENISSLLNLASTTIIVGITNDKSADISLFNTVNNSGVFQARLPEAVGGFYDGVYSGLEFYGFEGSATGAAQLSTFINNHIKTIDNIFLMYMCPTAICPNIDSGTHKISNAASSTNQYGAGDPPSLTNDTFDGYHPINAKLFTYPYNYFELNNGSGETLVTRYEFFKDLTPRFVVDTTFMNPVTLVARPTGYKGSTYVESQGMGVRQPLYPESITITNYPLCSWSYDAYNRWSATRTPQILRSGLVDAMKTIPSLAGLTMERQRNAKGQLGRYWIDYASGNRAFSKNQLQKMNIASAGTNLIDKASSIYEERYEASIAVDPAKGNTASANADFSAGNLNFWKMRTRITGEMAQVVDEYFSVFGYKTNLVKVPNLNNRTHWNYVKTVNSLLEKRSDGKVNSSDIAQMESIFDNGITFWHNPSEVGDYTRAMMESN